MILVTGEFRMPLDSLDDARRAMTRVIEATRLEAGCLSYAYAEDVLEPGLFRVTETWTDRAALSAHFSTDHMVRWQYERAALGLTGRSVIAHVVTQSEPL